MTTKSWYPGQLWLIISTTAASLVLLRHRLHDYNKKTYVSVLELCRKKQRPNCRLKLGKGRLHFGDMVLPITCGFWTPRPCNSNTMHSFQYGLLINAWDDWDKLTDLGVSGLRDVHVEWTRQHCVPVSADVSLTKHWQTRSIVTCSRVINHLTPTVAIWVQLWNILQCETGLSQCHL